MFKYTWFTISWSAVIKPTTPAAVITGKEYKADIPYTAQVKKFYYDGTSSIGTVSGVYKGVAIAEAGVYYGEIESLDGGEGDISK